MCSTGNRRSRVKLRVQGSNILPAYRRKCYKSVNDISLATQYKTYSAQNHADMGPKIVRWFSLLQPCLISLPLGTFTLVESINLRLQNTSFSYEQYWNTNMYLLLVIRQRFLIYAFKNVVEIAVRRHHGYDFSINFYALSFLDDLLRYLSFIFKTICSSLSSVNNSKQFSLHELISAYNTKSYKSIRGAHKVIYLW